MAAAAASAAETGAAAITASPAAAKGLEGAELLGGARRSASKEAQRSSSTCASCGACGASADVETGAGAGVEVEVGWEVGGCECCCSDSCEKGRRGPPADLGVVVASAGVAGREGMASSIPAVGVNDFCWVRAGASGLEIGGAGLGSGDRVLGRVRLDARSVSSVEMGEVASSSSWASSLRLCSFDSSPWVSLCDCCCCWSACRR